MKSCDCCDHPLEHAIAQALEAFDNGRPRVSVGAIVGQLRQDLAEWQDEQVWDREQRLATIRAQRAIGEREQASADGEVWPEPETCGECGHELHEGACKEWVVNHTFGTGGLDKPCQCSKR